MSSGGHSNQQDPYREPTQRTGWYGWIAFAGIIMCVLGAFHVIVGLVALFEEDYFVVGESELVLTVDYSAWGWYYLIMGVITVAAGLALTQGATWARIVAVAVAAVSAVSNMAFLSASPVWSTIMIAVDILVIFAVTAHGGRTSLEGY